MHMAWAVKSFGDMIALWIMLWIYICGCYLAQSFSETFEIAVPKKNIIASLRRIFCMPAKHCIFYPVLLCSRSSLCWTEWSLLWWVWQAPWSSAFFYMSTLRTQRNRMKIRVGGQSLECTVTLLQGHLSRMHSVENLICLSNGKRVAWKIFRWWKIVLQVLAFVKGGCIHFCLDFSIHQGNVNIWPYVVLIHLDTTCENLRCLAQNSRAKLCLDWLKFCSSGSMLSWSEASC